MKKPNFNRFRSYLHTLRARLHAVLPKGLGWRLRTLPLTVVVPLALVATATVMFMVATTDTAINTFSFGTADVTIDEGEIDPDNVEWGTNTKPVSIENTGEVSGVVRVMFVPVLTDSDGNVISGDLGDITASPSGTTLVLGDITLHLVSDWQTYWFYQDGYFYYKYVLDPGEETTQLLSGVTLTDGSYDDVSLTSSVITPTVEVLADIIQTEGTALDEWGLTVSEGVVTTKQ